VAVVLIAKKKENQMLMLTFDSYHYMGNIKYFLFFTLIKTLNDRRTSI